VFFENGNAVSGTTIISGKDSTMCEIDAGLYAIM
jgi:hypothetical protein